MNEVNYFINNTALTGIQSPQRFWVAPFLSGFLLVGAFNI